MSYRIREFGSKIGSNWDSHSKETQQSFGPNRVCQSVQSVCRRIDPRQPDALYAINDADSSKRYPLIVETARRIDGSAILDAEVVWLGSDGVANFDACIAE